MLSLYLRVKQGGCKVRTIMEDVREQKAEKE